MNFNTHLRLTGRHAFLSPSKYHWVNYDDAKFDRMFVSVEAAKRGTELHDLAHNLIRLGVKLPRQRTTLNAYVNDAIGLRMTPEQILYYSDNAFGQCDAICFRNGLLRIHDLKTGAIPASIHQLEIYAAFFCLEYQMKPHDLAIELRIYQNDDMDVFIPDPADIRDIMDTTIRFDQIIEARREELLS